MWCFWNSHYCYCIADSAAAGTKLPMITPQSAAAGCKVVKTSEEPAWEQRELPSAPGTHQQRSTTVPYRSLIYDANLGCLRFSRHSAGGGPGGGGARGTAAAADYCISAGSPQHGAENFRRLLLPESIYSSSSLASCRQQRNKARHQYHNDDADECSGNAHGTHRLSVPLRIQS